MSQEGVDDWFLTSELPVRVSSASMWTVVLSGIWSLVLMTMSLMYQSPLQPMTGIYTLLMPSFSTFYFIILAVLSVGASVSCSSSFTVTSSKPKNLSNLISGCLNPQTLLSLVTSGILSLISTVCFLKLAWPQLSEDRFLLGCGLVTGVHQSFQFYLLSSNKLRFPIINKEISSQLKEVLSMKMLTKSVLESVKILQFYCITSFLISLAVNFSLPCSISLSLGLATFLVTTFLTLSHNTRLAVFSIYLTSPLPSVDHHQLLVFLTSASPLLRTLSLQALSRQTSVTSTIRSHIFSLSQPGGHPTNWKTVSKVCLDNINALFPASKETPASVTSTPVTSQTSLVQTPTMRRLTAGASATNGTKLQDISLSSPPTPQRISLFPTFEALKNIGQPADQTVDVMSMISSVEVIAQMVCSSLLEDKFGVVQRDLTMILTNLVKLDNELSRNKLQEIVFQQNVLRQTVKAALYKISIKFGPHLNDISLPGNVAQKMKNYSKLLEV